MIRNPSTRRTVLSGIATGIVAAIGGCLGGSDRSEVGGLGTTSVFDDVYVDGLDLVLEVTDSSSLEQVNIIDPADELFAEQPIATGVERETIELGTSYQPGEYRIVALEDDDEIATASLEIEPDVRITDLRLGRNNPDEMFEGASDIDVRTEAIILLENAGSGPDEINTLSFSGAVPRPTPADFSESGIYNTSSGMREHADAVELLSDSEVTIYSQSMPFSSAGSNIYCSAETTEGEFEVTLECAVQEEPVTAAYLASYTGENIDDCDIEVVEQL